MKQPVADREVQPLVQPDEFFIGWRAMPRAYAGFLRRLLLPWFTLVVGAAWLLPSWQQSPGPGAWDSDRVLTLEGLAVTQPYALLHVPPAKPGESSRTVLLVEQGKFGAAERLRPFAGQWVRVSGTFLHRDDRWMLELSRGDDAIQRTSPGQPAIPPGETDLGPVTLRGEFIDPKCYLGAMKPGGGKTHKACAVLCLSGGIPPMFVTRDAARHETFHLVTAQDGSAIGTPLLPFVGDPVEVKGTLSLRGDLRWLRLDARNIQRL